MPQISKNAGLDDLPLDGAIATVSGEVPGAAKKLRCSPLFDCRVVRCRVVQSMESPAWKRNRWTLIIATWSSGVRAALILARADFRNA